MSLLLFFSFPLGLAGYWPQSSTDSINTREPSQSASSFASVLLFKQFCKALKVEALVNCLIKGGCVFLIGSLQGKCSPQHTVWWHGIQDLGCPQLQRKCAPALIPSRAVRWSFPFLHPHRLHFLTQLSAALRLARRLACSSSVSCSLWPLFGQTLQMRKELTPCHCLFWCFHRHSQMKQWIQRSQGCPISAWCPGIRFLAFLWGPLHLKRWV